MGRLRFVFVLIFMLALSPVLARASGLGRCGLALRFAIAYTKQTLARGARAFGFGRDNPDVGAYGNVLTGGAQDGHLKRLYSKTAFLAAYPMTKQAGGVLFGPRSAHHRLNADGNKSISQFPGDTESQVRSHYKNVSDIFFMNFSTGTATLHITFHMKKDGTAVAEIGPGFDNGLTTMGRGLDDQQWDHLRNRNAFFLGIRDSYTTKVPSMIIHPPLIVELNDSTQIVSFFQKMDGQFNLSAKQGN